MATLQLKKKVPGTQKPRWFLRGQQRNSPLRYASPEQHPLLSQKLMRFFVWESMATQYYLKLYHEMLDDWKILSLPDGLKWRFIQCLLVAGEVNRGGWLPDIRPFAARIRPMEPEALRADLVRLASAELLELGIDGDGCERWFVSNFEKRQERSKNAKYQADWRKREKEKKEAKKRKEEIDKEDIYIDIDTSKLTSKNLSNLTSKLTSKTHTNTYDAHPENQALNDVISAICSVVKNGDPLAPSAELERCAHYIIDLDAVEKIPAFTNWWKTNSYYDDNGRPALKSFRDEFQNYLDGVGRKVSGQQETQTEHLAGSY